MVTLMIVCPEQTVSKRVTSAYNNLMFIRRIMGTPCVLARYIIRVAGLWKHVILFARCAGKATPKYVPLGCIPFQLMSNFSTKLYKV